MFSPLVLPCMPAESARRLGRCQRTFQPGKNRIAALGSLQVGQPYSMDLSVSVRTVTGSSDNVFLMLVARGSPVFIRPEGYTANSTDGMIVERFYQRPVPEPNSPALLAFTGAVVGARRRRA